MVNSIRVIFIINIPDEARGDYLKDIEKVIQETL